MNERLQEWIKRDLLYIIVCCGALVACIYTIMHTDAAVATCNEHWQEQLQGVTCYKGYAPIHIGGISNVSMQSNLPHTQKPGS